MGGKTIMKRSLFKVVSIMIVIALLTGVLSIIPVSASETYGDYNYIELEDGTVAIVMYKGSDNNLIIPSTINGKTVSQIGTMSFWYNDYLEYVKLPTNLVSIDSLAFAFCPNLKEIEFPKTLETVEYNFLAGTKPEKVSIAYGLKKIPENFLKENDKLTEITIPDTVTDIGTNAFYKCTALSEITLPKSLKTIGKDAFAYTNITSVTIPSGIEAGYGAFRFSALKTAVFEDGTTCIPNGMFRSCEKLNKVTMPNTVTALGSEIFWGDTALTYLELSSAVSTTDYLPPFSGSSIQILKIAEGMERVPDYLCSEMTSLVTVQLPDSVTEIGKEAFKQCSSLNTIEFPKNLTTIDDKTFNGTGLTEITLPKSLTTCGDFIFMDSALSKVTFESGTVKIPDNACEFAGELKTVVIPSTVKEIGNGAFAGCSKLSGVKFPLALESLGSGAFGGCTEIKSIVIPKTLKECGASPFSNSGITDVKLEYGLATIYQRMFYDCANLETIKIPSSITEIGTEAFRNCSALKSITIPAKVKTVGTYVFNNSGLESVVLQDGMVEIPDYIFSWCKNLKNVSMPDTVKTIGEEAFRSCTSLELIDFSSSLEVIDTRAFYLCNNLKSVTFPDTFVKTSIASFADCTSLEEVNFNENIKEIVGFDNCSSLKSVVIPKNAKVIYGCGFGFVDDQLVEDFIIYGYRNSSAESYANKYGVKFVAIDAILGDVDNSGIVNVNDATLVQKYCAKLIGESEINLDVADVNKDGEVNISDATAIQKMLVA